MIAAPDTANDLHVEVLSRLATLLMDNDFRQSLLDAKSTEEFLQLINKAEAEKFAEQAPAKEVSTGYDVLAVTACPTGIAHTFMAAESLEMKAKEMGIRIKVETNGSGLSLIHI